MPTYIQLKTSVPGPRSRELFERRNQAVPRGIAHATPIFIERGEGALLQDVDGNTYIDFAGGIGTMNAGHTNPEIIQAAASQLQNFTHTCFSVALYENYVELAEKLNAITPGDFRKKTMFANSGAEGIENAVKIARHHTKREGVVVFEHAFHGRTLLAMSMTSKVKPYKFGFGPFAPEIYRLSFPYSFRNVPAPDLNVFFQTQVAAEKVACVVLELVIGEGGFLVAPPHFVKQVEEVCRKEGILLIIDEVQTGFGRTGEMFACRHYNLEPDLIVMAKSLAGGFPLSAITGKADVMDSAQAGGLGGTYVGNPVSVAAGLAAVHFIEKERLPERAKRIGEKLRTRFQHWMETAEYIGEVRGLGAMMALEIVKDRSSKEPDKERTNRILQKCYENGLIVLSAGTFGNVIRTLMPLVITDDQLEEGLEVLHVALR